MPIMACRMPSTVTSRCLRLPHVTLESTAALPENRSPKKLSTPLQRSPAWLLPVAAARTLPTSTMYVADSVVAWLSSSGRCLSVLRSQGPAPSQSANVRAVSKPKAQERRTGRGDACTNSQRCRAGDGADDDYDRGAEIRRSVRARRPISSTPNATESA